MAKQKTAITPTREENFPEWFQQVIRAAEMAENSPTRGCMTIKPNGYALWENMQRIFDDMIKEEDVQNVYFPLLIPLSFMSKEAEHVDGFAKECAVVTHHRLEQNPDGSGLHAAPDAKLEEPYIIRPTSETIIGEAMSRWVQSYRDLPLKLNQWCNVLRWEMRTRLFLRTAEFLWQEGHNAFETAEQANDDARKMLHVYADFSEDYCAVPVIRGEKTIEERFPGANATYTMEAMMQDGKALQAATSHDLGQNFSKSIGIKFQSRDETQEFAHTTSWGLSTRMIGGMIMIHGDDDGMIMPPRVAPHQIVIIPVIKEETADKVNAACEELKAKLKAKGLRVFFDNREARTPDKMWGAIKKGIPLRVEIGGNEVEAGTLTHTRRDLGRDSKTTCSVDDFMSDVQGILDQMQSDMFERAKAFLHENIVEGNSLDDIAAFFKANKVGFVKVPVSLLDDAGLEKIYKDYSLTARCMPFADKGEKVLIGKAY